MDVHDIGVSDETSDENALLCKTDKNSCCKTSKKGEWHYPMELLLNIMVIAWQLVQATIFTEIEVKV